MESKKNGKVYVGTTAKEPQERVDEHNDGSNKWSKANRPFTLRYYEKYVCQKDSRTREIFYKTGFGKQIKYLILDKLAALKI